MIKWQFQNKKLSLFRENNTLSAVITFGREGNMSTEGQCIESVNRFILEHGGPDGRHQWLGGFGEKIHNEIWQAAKTVWGQPRLEQLG